MLTRIIGKNHLIDPDTIMTDDEYRLFKQSMREQKEGKSIPISEMKKNLRL